MAKKPNRPPTTPPSIDLELTEPARPRHINRLTCVLQLSHQVHGRDGTPFVARFADLLDSSDDAYSRRVQVSGEISPIDLAWCGVDARYLAIENRAGLDLLTQPTEEEQRHISGQLIFYGPKEKPDAFFVPPRGRVNLVALAPNTKLVWFATHAPVEARIFVCRS
jgi:hypothetical protein